MFHIQEQNMYSQNQNIELLKQHTVNTFSKILQQYQQKFPQHVNRIRNALQTGEINIDTLVTTICNTQGVIDMSGQINNDTFVNLINVRIQHLLKMIDSEMQQTQFQNQPMSTNLSFQVQSQPQPQINMPQDTPFINMPKQSSEQFTIEEVVEGEVELHIEIKDLSKTEFMLDKQNMFRKGFKVDKIYSNNDRNIPSIIIGKSNTHTTTLSAILNQFYICYINGFKKHLNTSHPWCIKIEYDDTYLDEIHDKSMKFFEEIYKVATTKLEGINEDSKNKFAEYYEFERFVKEITKLENHEITSHARSFEKWGCKKLNYYLSKYFRYLRDNDYDYFDTYPSVSKISDIVNQERFINFLKKNDFCQDETLMRDALNLVKQDFMYDIIYRDTSPLVTKKDDLEYILYNTSLPFNFVDSQDKSSGVDRIKNTRKQISSLLKTYEEVLPEPDAITDHQVNSDINEKLDKIYFETIGDSIGIFKDKKRIIIQNMIGEPDMTFMTADIITTFGNIDENVLERNIKDIFKDIDYLIRIGEDDDNVYFHIYRCYYTIEQQNIYEFFKTEILEKDPNLIEFD